MHLQIPWELSKDSPFAYITTYNGFEWNLQILTVTVGEKKKVKYLLAIKDWNERNTHSLREVQKLYGKLLHTCLVVPCGRAYLTGLEAMLAVRDTSPYIPHSSPKGLRDDLRWWWHTLSKPILTRPIPGPAFLWDMGAFSDASSGIGITIIINGRWRAWRLIPGWQTLDGQKDIGWAEALGFEFLVRVIVESLDLTGHFQTHSDNQGVVDGWRNSCSRNNAVNTVFCRIHNVIDSTNGRTNIWVSYVPSASNPADLPSRGIYASHSLLLPPSHSQMASSAILWTQRSHTAPSSCSISVTATIQNPSPGPYTVTSHAPATADRSLTNAVTSRPFSRTNTGAVLGAGIVLLPAPSQSSRPKP